MIKTRLFDFRTRIGTVLLVFAFSATIAHSSADVTSAVQSKQDSARKRARYDSPKAVLSGCVKAVQKQDWRTFIDCHSEDALLPMTTSFLIFSNIVAQGSKAMPERFRETYSKLTPVLKKHGLTHEKILKMDPPELSGLDEVRAWKAMADYVKPIKNRTEFCADFATVLLKLPASKQRVKGMQSLWKSSELSELKTNGDRAYGSRKVTSGDGTRKERIDFLKAKDGWRIHVNRPSLRNN